MATINISDIRPAGYDLFSDDDKYMSDLNNDELNRVVGGTEPISATIAVSIGVAAGAAFLGGLWAALR